MLKMAREVLDWIGQQVPDPPRSLLGRRPSFEKRTVVFGISWRLDNGAKWENLLRRFGNRSAMGRSRRRWVEEGVFE